MIPWLRAGSVGIALAALAWFVPWQLSVSADSPLRNVAARVGATLIVLISGVAVTRLLERRLDARRAQRRLMEEFERRIASLEEAMAIASEARLRFEYDSHTQLARLHVTNHGADGTFRAPLTVDGALSSRLNHHVFARWEHADAPEIPIPSGETRTLRLAQLDVSSFPFAQWCIHTASEEGTLELYAMHGSVIGGAPDTHAPALFLDVAILSTPHSARLCECTIVLHPFAAERLRS